MIPYPVAGFIGAVIATKLGDTLYRRAAESFDASVTAYHQRVQAGQQPSTVGVDLFSMETQEKILIWMNLGYLLITCALYLFMRRREKAYQLKRVLTIYNLANVLISAYICYEIIKYKINQNPSFICNSLPPGEHGLAKILAVFYLQKYFEYWDTYFFIMRRSFRQVTFLHLFHHASITVIVGSLLPLDYDGDMYLPVLVNSICHVAVYSHYLLTCIGIQPFWSRYLTSFQMAQFAIIFLQSCLSWLKGANCGTDFVKARRENARISVDIGGLIAFALMCVYMGSMLVLFSDFFIKRYILKQPAVDMCGVIKSVDFSGGQTAAAYHGNARLGPTGAATVFLPRHFREGLTSTMYCYQLTPLGDSMPSLHIAHEVQRGLTPTPSKGAILGTASGRDGASAAALLLEGAAALRGRYCFAIAGGRPHSLVSWMVCVVSADDSVRMH